MPKVSTEELLAAIGNAENPFRHCCCMAKSRISGTHAASS